MALESANGLGFNQKKSIQVRLQEFDPTGNGRPHEEDLIEGGLHADSIGDLPIPGDYIGLQTQQFIPGTQKDPKFETRGGIFKVLTRLFDIDYLEKRKVITCNIVVQEETDETVIGRIVKD